MSVGTQSQITDTKEAFMLAVHGLYEKGTVRIIEPVNYFEKCDVIVTFLPPKYNTEYVTPDDEFVLSDPKSNTVKEKFDAIDSLIGICKDNTLTLNDIKTERLNRQ